MERVMLLQNEIARLNHVMSQTTEYETRVVLEGVIERLNGLLTDLLVIME